MNTLSEYIYFYIISKNITSYNFLLAFKIAESLSCILMMRCKTEMTYEPLRNEEIRNTTAISFNEYQKLTFTKTFCNKIQFFFGHEIIGN